MALRCRSIDDDLRRIERALVNRHVVLVDWLSRKQPLATGSHATETACCEGSVAERYGVVKLCAVPVGAVLPAKDAKGCMAAASQVSPLHQA